MPSPVSTLALFIPRPQIPLPSSVSTPATPPLPRTPNRSPIASHIFLSTSPTANRNSTDSWNSSNYDLDDPNAEWKEEELRLLVRTLDALPAHLITPFNGSIPPSNLLDKIARGITAAKGPNDWPHSARATRVKLLELARVKTQDDRIYRPLSSGASESDCMTRVYGKEGDEVWQGKGHNGQKSSGRERTPDHVDILQPRTNTPNHPRRPLYRQSSMDFLASVEPDRGESIARLSHRLQHHERILHHPYLRPAHVRRRSESTNGHCLSPSTPSSSTLNSSSNVLSGFRKSTASATSASSSFGSPMSTSAPLRPSSLRRASTITLATGNDVQVDCDMVATEENLSLDTGDGHMRGGRPHGTKVGVKVKRAPSYSGGKTNSTPVTLPSTSLGKPSKKARSTNIPVSVATKSKSTMAPAPTLKSPESSIPTLPDVPKTPPMEMCSLVAEKVTPPRPSASTKKYRKGHKPQLSVSSDEEDKVPSKGVKKARIREPSWSALLSTPTPQAPELLASPHIAHPKRREGSESGRSTSTGRGSKTSASSRESTDNDLSTSSTSTVATSVSVAVSLPRSTPKFPRTNPNLRIHTKPLYNHVPSESQKAQPVRRTLARNPSMFGAELPCPQPTPTSPSRIPLSSPRMSISPSPRSPAPDPSTPPQVPTPVLSPVSSRPRTLRRAARRISFGSLAAGGGLMNSIGNGQSMEGVSGTLALGSAFRLA